MGKEADIKSIIHAAKYKQVAQHLIAGYSVKKIAESMNISSAAVRKLMADDSLKMYLRNQADIMINAAASTWRSAMQERIPTALDALDKLLEKGDAEAFVKLVYPQGVTDEIRSKLLENFQFNLDMDMSLSKLEISALTEEIQTENVISDVSYKLNLEPTARLNISLSMVDKDGGESDAPSSYLLGEHEGRLYITTAVPLEPETSDETETDA